MGKVRVARKLPRMLDQINSMIPPRDKYWGKLFNFLPDTAEDLDNQTGEQQLPHLINDFNRSKYGRGDKQINFTRGCKHIPNKIGGKDLRLEVNFVNTYKLNWEHICENPQPPTPLLYKTPSPQHPMVFSD